MQASQSWIMTLDSVVNLCFLLMVSSLEEDGKLKLTLDLIAQILKGTFFVELRVLKILSAALASLVNKCLLVVCDRMFLSVLSASC